MISKIRSRTYRLLHARGLDVDDYKMVLDQVINQSNQTKRKYLADLSPAQVIEGNALVTEAIHQFQINEGLVKAPLTPDELLLNSKNLAYYNSPRPQNEPYESPFFAGDIVYLDSRSWSHKIRKAPRSADKRPLGPYKIRLVVKLGRGPYYYKLQNLDNGKAIHGKFLGSSITLKPKSNVSSQRSKRPDYKKLSNYK